MAIPSRQIGWGTDSNLLWQISKQLEYLTKVTSQISGGGGSSTDKEFVVTTYTVKTAFTGASVGDVITCTQVIDVTTNTPVTVTTIWRNQTTATDLSSVPSFTNLSLEGTTALTDAELRATPVPISPRPNTTGTNGTSAYKLISSPGTNANNIKTSGGNLYSIIAIGLTSNVRYLKLYNKATAPTVGTDIPIMTIPIPANTQGAGVAIPFSMGVNFSAGIGIAITSGAGDTDTGAVLANDVIVNLTYA